MGRCSRRAAWLDAVLVVVSFFLLPGRAAAGDVSIVPSADGHLGAWQALGPVRATAKGNRAPRDLDTPALAGGVDESALTARLGRSVPITVPEGAGADAPTSATWRVVAAENGPIDLAQALNHRGGEAFAFLYGVLHLSERLKGFLLLGASDGVRVFVDRKVVWSTDGSRAEHDDEDVIKLDLPAGDHGILMKLHHRDVWWAVRARIVDATFAAPRGAFLRLTGTGDAEMRALTQRMTDIVVNRGLSDHGFRPTVAVSFPEGMPRGVDRTVHVSAFARIAGRSKPLFAFEAGEVPLGDSGPSELKVHLPTIGQDEMAEELDGGELVISVEVAGRKLDAPLQLRPFMPSAVAAANRALSLLSGGFLADPAVVRATIEQARDRFVRRIAGGDSDLEALASEAQTLIEHASDVEAKRDPLRAHAGIRRFAYRSPLDGEPSNFGMYVPKSFAEGRSGSRKFPLVVVLHGLNGKPISMLRWFFGRDDDGRDTEWVDRHPGEVEPIDAFVLAPNAHGNAMYRELGEIDVIRLVEWAAAFYPVDPDRITITGASMGGTGAASISFHYPDRFAAAMPLCGYHSYFIRKDVTGRGLWPWEKLISEYRSPVMWAENGLYLPLYVWHGKRDYPEKNSGILIDRYSALGYSVEHEHPDIGHDVWKKAYEGLLGFRWLSQKTRPEHKRRILFKTDSPRYLDDGWVHLRQIAMDLEFSTIDASIVDPTQIEVSTHGVEAFALDRDPELVSSGTPTRVKVDGNLLVFEAGAPIAAHRGDGGAWRAGLTSPPPGHKRPGLSGPMRDIFFEPLVFVYGASDPAQTRANRETARAWARIKFGVDIRYPVVSDIEFDDKAAETHSLVLVGNAESNRVVRALEPQLPFKVTASSIVGATEGASKEWKGKDLGVAFIYPNPKHPGRYLLVIEGTSALGTIRAIALPEVLPDFIVFDDRIAPARGQLVLAGGLPMAAGLFRPDWSFGKLELGRSKTALMD